MKCLFKSVEGRAKVAFVAWRTLTEHANVSVKCTPGVGLTEIYDLLKMHAFVHNGDAQLRPSHRTQSANELSRGPLT